MSLAIRHAVADDAPIIHRFVQELAVYEREPDAVEATIADYRRQLQADPPPFECLIAELGGEAAGFALFFPSYSTWRGRAGIHLEDLYVTPRFRGRGAGKALLARLAALAVERGCGRLEWSVLDWNEPAIAFYEALGARPMTGWTTYRLSRDALDRVADLATPD